MRRLFPAPALALAVLSLAACASQPQGSYQDYTAARDAELNGGVIAGPDVSSTTLEGMSPAQTYGGSAPVPVYPGSTAAATSANVAANVAASGPERAAVFAGISDEQSFNAVSSRETIESDRARIERNRAQYQQIAPTALPQRRNSGGPNIVVYALQTTNPVGQPMYSRVNPLRGNMNTRACAKYGSPDQAQEAFLRAGGPERDPRSLDPDGDGYACYWDPTPFRSALR